MKNASGLLLSLVGTLAVCAPSVGAQPNEGQAAPCGDAPACEWHPCGLHCLDWTLGCFPRWGCPDDYCPNPYPRQCWPPYLPFYVCAPAGDFGLGCGGRRDDRLTWWFVPTPRALRDALWLRL